MLDNTSIDMCDAKGWHATWIKVLINLNYGLKYAVNTNFHRHVKQVIKMTIRLISFIFQIFERTLLLN